LRGCGFTRRERAAVQAELARAVAEQAELDRAFDLALEALQPTETIRAAHAALSPITAIRPANPWRGASVVA
jgi:hypothetical protein